MRKFFLPLNKQYEQLSDPSTRSLLSSHTVLVDGKLLSGKDLRVYAKRHGLCQICGQTKTHQRGGSILHRTWEPITATMDGRNYIVYKVYCLQPTCYTLNKAQEKLGERQKRPKRRRKTRKTTTTSTTSMTTPSDSIRSTDLYSHVSTRRTSTTSRRSSDPTQFNSSNSTGMSSSSSTHSLPRFLPSLLTSPREQEEEEASTTEKDSCVGDIVVSPNRTLSDDHDALLHRNMYHNPDYYYQIVAVRPVSARLVVDPLPQLQNASTSVHQILTVLEEYAHDEQVIQVGFEALQKALCLIPDDNKDSNNNDNHSCHSSLVETDEEESVSPRWATVVWKILSSYAAATVITTTTTTTNKKPWSILRQGLVTVLDICQQSHQHAEQAAVEGLAFLLTLARTCSMTNIDSQDKYNDEDEEDNMDLVVTEIRNASAVLLEKFLTHGMATNGALLQSTQSHQQQQQQPDDDHDKEDWILLPPLLQEAVELLVQQLDKPTFDVTDSDAVRLQEYRARSLYHLADCCHRQTHVATTLTGDKHMPGCRTVLLGLLLQDDILTDLGLQATLSLLAMIFSSSRENNSNSQALGPEGLGAITAILVRDDSFDTHKAAINLLHIVITHDPNILRQDDDQTSLDVVLSICDFLGHHYLQSDHEELIRLGLMVLLNVFPYLEPHHVMTDEQRRELVTSIIKCMQVAPERSSILSVGVLLLSALLEWEEETTKIVSDAGGTDLLIHIFRQSARRNKANDDQDSEADGDADDDMEINDTRLETLVQTTTLSLAKLVEFDRDSKLDISLLSDVQAAARTATDGEILEALFRIVEAIVPRIRSSLSLYQGPQDASDTILLSGGAVEGVLKDCTESSAEIVSTLRKVATFYERLDYSGNLDQLWLYPNSDHSSSTKVVTHTQTELRAIVQVMENSSDDDDIVDACYATLAAFFRSTSTTQDPLAGPVHEDISRVLLHALDTFKNRRTNSRQQMSASPLFWALLCRYDGGVINKWTGRLLECLHDANCDDPKTEPVFVVACDLLGIFSSRPRATSSLGRLQLVKFFQTLMKAQSYQIALAASRGLASLLGSDPEASSLLVSLDGISSSLVTCLERHQAADQIQRSIFSILLSQHLLEDVGFRHEIANLGGFKALVTAMAAHYSDSSFVLPAYRCLLATLTEVEVDIVWGLRGHICEILVETFDSHGGDVDIQTAGTDLIRSICVKDGRFREILAGTGSIIPLLLSTMAEHMSCPVLLANGCTAIRMLARYDLKQLLVQHEAVDVVVNVMVSHAGSPDVLKEAMTTLTKLSSEAAIRGKIDCEKAETTIVCLIEAYPYDPEILKEALGALNNLLVLRMIDPPVASCMADNVLKVLLASVKYFLNEEALQMNASLLLKSYTYEPHHLHLLQNASDVLVPLLFDVSENYAGEIRERAQYIIHSL